MIRSTLALKYYYKFFYLTVYTVVEKIKRETEGQFSYNKYFFSLLYIQENGILAINFYLFYFSFKTQMKHD